MKRLRILPSASRIIALTAIIGFVDGQFKIDAESFSGGKITSVSTKAHITTITAGGALPGNQQNNKSDILAYIVEIRHGHKLANVLIDAVTGRILL
ncbi:MAG: hypothetical protein PHD65_12060 [Gallionella sp.]|nr:hypothetical protein [Gallionella sp.]